VPDAPGDDWIGVSAAAKLLGVQMATVRALIDQGTLPAEFKLPSPRPKSRRRAIRLHRHHVEDYIERARVKPGELRHLHPTWDWDRYRA
jgi:excisionase family DNA binding protein